MYELVEVIAHSRDGATYLARDPRGARHFVELLFDPHLASDRARFDAVLQSAKRAAAIDRRRIVQVHDGGVDAASNVPYLVSTPLLGEDLEAQVARAGALPAALATSLFCKAAATIARAHERRIIHGALAPQRVFLVRDGAEPEVSIGGFGLGPPARELLTSTDGGRRRSDVAHGDLRAMPPEQLRGARVTDERSDVWSLGACLYFALSGASPWGHVRGIGELVVATHAHEVPRLRSRAPSIARELEQVVHRALSRDPSQRTGSAAALAEELRILAPAGMRGADVTLE